MRLTRLFVCTASALVLAACGGGGGGSSSAPAPTPTGGVPAPAPTPTPTPTPTPPVSTAPPSTALETKAEAADFLRMAGFGGPVETAEAVTGQDAAQWVRAQMNQRPIGYLQSLSARMTEEDAKNRDSGLIFWEAMLTSDAELRTRMTFALSQMFVISDRGYFQRGYDLANWTDILDRNAFGNFRDLMGEVTTNPLMGDYLTFLYNQKGDPEKGRQPDENYARELLQLFTIGLVELNMDGTVKTDADGQPIETYDNDDIIGLARVFTGYAYDGSSYRYRDRAADFGRRPMKMYDEYHSELEKSFLGTTIPAGTPGEASVEQALDAIFAHPNVAPFVSRQLIQRFTASNPEPAYVERVARVFEAGTFTSEDGTRFGDGRRGSLEATLAAILLDESVHDGVRRPSEGKVREPVLKFVQYARTYSKPETLRVARGSYNSITDTSDAIENLGQAPFKSPSVFNFYRPGFIAPSTETGEAGYTAPELQIVNASAALGYVNFMSSFIIRNDDIWDGILVPDFSQEIALADDTDALIDRVDLTLLAGTMGDTTRTAIKETLEALPVRENNADRDRLARVRLAMLMTVSSADYVALN